MSYLSREGGTGGAIPPGPSTPRPFHVWAFLPLCSRKWLPWFLFLLLGLNAPTTAPQGRRCLFQPLVQGYSPAFSGKLRQRHLEEAGHVPPTTRKLRVMDACCCSSPFSPKQSRIQPGNGVAQSEWVPTSVKTIEIVSHRHAQGPISQVILDSVK